MKIAVASQNREQITEHAGLCRKFWIYETGLEAISGKELLELPKEQSFHESSPHDPHPLDGVQILIAGNMGKGLVRRLEAKGIKAIITPETNPDKAVAAFLDGSLATSPPEAHDHTHENNPNNGHGHDHSHGHACHCNEYSTYG